MEDPYPPAKRLKTSHIDKEDHVLDEIPESPPFIVEIVKSSSQSPPTPEATPRKKRKSIGESKERKTEHLNLRTLSNDSKIQQKQLATLFHVLNKKKKIVVIAGAGISVGAGSKLPFLFDFPRPPPPPPPPPPPFPYLSFV